MGELIHLWSQTKANPASSVPRGRTWPPTFRCLLLVTTNTAKCELWIAFSLCWLGNHTKPPTLLLWWFFSPHKNANQIRKEADISLYISKYTYVCNQGGQTSWVWAAHQNHHLGARATSSQPLYPTPATHMPCPCESPCLSHPHDSVLLIPQGHFPPWSRGLQGHPSSTQSSCLAGCDPTSACSKHSCNTHKLLLNSSSAESSKQQEQQCKPKPPQDQYIPLGAQAKVPRLQLGPLVFESLASPWLCITTPN